MDEKRKLIRHQDDALHTIESIKKERQEKDNANVTAGRYGELVANMVKFSESQMALKMLNQESETLPSRQHVEPESLHGQNVINPT
ncbi:MAG: hypothetical protein KAX49_12840 [Halanaerobiales bacterium]|nr:hypothetical protein [Halanaerobiales bacterium]